MGRQGKSIEPAVRVAEVQQAYELSLQGRSVNRIAKELDRDRSTINRYLVEARAIVSQETGDLDQLRTELADKHRYLYEVAVENLNDPSMTARTQTGPQWNKSAKDNLLAIAELHGVKAPQKVDVRQHTLIEFLTSEDSKAVIDDPTYDPTWSAQMPERFIKLCLQHDLYSVEELHDQGVITTEELAEAQGAMAHDQLEPADYVIVE